MFSIITQGNWHPGQISMTEVPSGRRIVDEVEQGIESAWRAAAKPGVQLFDGPMCRLESYDASADVLHLRFSPTSYRINVGTNLNYAAALADRYGSDVFANPLGASVALTTSDGHLLLGRRGGRVAYYPHRVHPFAGAVEPRECRDVFEIVYRELQEELNLPREQVRDVRCIGLVQDNSIRQPELIFTASTPRTSAAVASELDDAEHDSIWPVKLEPAALDTAVDDPILTPIAAATITMWRAATWQ
ncbi:MAG TPA: NUDIX hydrolase [Tepidisphaeraceae bacterium]|jgi:8-oxo-dGTP pyrophosphatase MutT (NUDIX family)|nr:NUDIX hydrolase [Tepidisphaeraceae bacterium]